MTSTQSLRISGAIETASLELAYDDCVRCPESAQVPDVGALVPGRQGRAVRLRALLERVRPRSDAAWINLVSRDPAFAVSVPLAEIADQSLVVYALDGAPLPLQKGGPFRLLVPGHPDECVNVKDLAGLELANRAGRDTRPRDDVEHAKLHARRG